MTNGNGLVAPIAQLLCAALLTLGFACPPVSAQGEKTRDAPQSAASASPTPSSDGRTPAAATQTPQQTDAQAALIKESQNPVGNITLIQFQNNLNYGYGPYVRDQYDLNVQPVVPIELRPNLNLVTRFITPIIDQPSFAPAGVCASTSGCPARFGIGDLTPQFFFAPRTKPNALIWGAGPQFLLPTGNSSGTSAGKYGVGPAIVGLIMPGPIVTGLLVTQMFSYAGNAKRPNISALLVMPFFDYNLKSWAIFFGSSGVTANWEATPSGRWLVPVGTGVLKTFRIKAQTMQLGIYYFGNVVRPVGAPFGTVRFNYNVVFPIKRGR
jgi:hypothetical protein